MGACLNGSGISLFLKPEAFQTLFEEAKSGLILFFWEHSFVCWLSLLRIFDSKDFHEAVYFIAKNIADTTRLLVRSEFRRNFESSTGACERTGREVLRMAGRLGNGTGSRPIQKCNTELQDSVHCATSSENLPTKSKVFTIHCTFWFRNRMPLF